MMSHTAHAGLLIKPPLYIGLNSGLVGSWTFDAPDLAGTVAYDRSSGAHNGTLTNTPLRGVGKIGQALSFNSANTTYVTAGNVGSGIMTVAFWMKAPDVTSQKLISIDGTKQIETNGSDAIVATSFPAATVYVDGIVGSAVKDGQWHHVVVTDTTGVTGTTFEIGRVVATYFTGTIDDVRIYNRALTPQEIKRLYNIGGTLHIAASQNNKITNGLIGMWSFDAPDLAGTVAYDRSGQGNDGTLTNDPTRAIGKIGQALSFDGADDYVTITNPGLPTNLDFTSGNKITLSAWIYPTNLPSEAAII
jgi:hypothetical protein